MKLKKILVAALAVTMIMGSSSMAFAAEQKGEGAGAGDLDVVKDSDVFSVVVPTDAGTTFDYIVDPLGVIKETDAEKYGNKVFEDGPTVFFQNTDAEVSPGEYNYSGTSNKLKAINKSTKAVDLSVEATLTGTDEVTMAEAGTVTGTTDVLLNLQLNGGAAGAAASETAAIGAGSSDAEITAAIDETANAYETKYVNGKYVKQIKDSLTDDDFEAYEFWLTGKANASSDWADVTTLPEVNVVWTVTGEGAEAGPRVTLSQSGLITVSGLTADANVANGNTDIKYGVDGNLYGADNANVTWDTTGWNKDTGGTLKIQMNHAYNVYNGKKVNVEVKLTNGTTIKCGTVVNGL